MRLIPRPVWIDTPFIRSSGSPEHWVLIESNEVFVTQDLQDIWLDGIQWRSNDQWRLQRGPHSKVGAILVNRQIPIAYFEHVPVSMAPEVGTIMEE